jgi:isopentenyl-diphosphate delta-isomerase
MPEHGVAFVRDVVGIGASCDGDHAREDSESLILVDEADRSIGYMSKAACHQGHGVLHRAFSLLIFNARGELLLQQRAKSKRLWPLHWSNSCCSHPRRGETMEAAICRRLHEELGVHCPMQFLFKFQYQAQFDSAHAEHEVCSVFIGRCTDSVKINRSEILAWRWISPAALQTELSGSGAQQFTPWFILEWKRIWREHRAALPSLHVSRMPQK